MKLRRKWVIALLVVLASAVILAGGASYVLGVRDALWTKAVTDILEVTAQGRHALDTYLEKDQETLHLLAQKLEKERSGDGQALRADLALFSADGASYFCADLTHGMAATADLAGYPLAAAELQAFQALEGQGVRKPFLDGYAGVRTFGIYARFTFADGAAGYVQKSQPLAELAERFSLSFYNDTGFSYVVDQDGEILIRSQHRNSNRTFQNLFDIIDLQGNDAQAVASFRSALAEGKRGVARFRYQKEDYVFCYVPMESAAGWYVVSIIPNSVIMEQANVIIQDSQILMLLIAICILVLTAFFLVYRDSTSRVLAAEEKARKAAESANAAKSRFLSNMSHDIRTPMNAIIGMTKLASDHAGEPDKVQEYLKNIDSSGQLLVGLINDILDLSKIESGKMTLNNDNASLEKLLANLVSIMQPTVAKKGQKFDIRLHGIQHETLCFDSLRLNQVLLNLLSNAVKFTPPGGAIGVDVTERPSPRAGYSHFTFHVADTGIGIQPEFLKDVFQSFTREQDSRVNKTEGSGLGMAITKMIVDMMEGTVAVRSTPGKGTTFTVDVDLLLAPEAPLEPLPCLRVLAADDDPATCRSAEEFLRELGMQADVTGGGRDAVDKALAAHAEGRDYDLILLDWKMPDLNGLDAVREIRRQTGREIPVIVFSAYDWARIAPEALAAGVDGFVQKPFFKSTLSRCIRHYVLHEEGLPQPQGEDVQLTGRHILLAEDNELNQEIARELLESAGAQLEIVGDGKACVERFSQTVPGAFDLILMDIQMPIMNGYEAARRIRALPRPDARTIPIFAMTADAFAEDIAAAKEAGMDSHLAKPLDIPAMLLEIQKYLGPAPEGPPAS